MSLPRNPLRFNVGFLLNQPIGYSRDIHFDYPDILLKPELRLSDFSGLVRAGRTPQGIIIHGEFQAQAPAECVRCLTETMQPLQTSFDELYAFNERSVTDSGLILPEDGNIDLEPIVREYLLIELPIGPICRSDCRGLCPVCGLNLNETPHEHKEEEE